MIPVAWYVFRYYGSPTELIMYLFANGRVSHNNDLSTDDTDKFLSLFTNSTVKSISVVRNLAYNELLDPTQP